MLGAVVASVCPHGASWELGLLIPGTRAMLRHAEGCSSLGLSQHPTLSHLASAQGRLARVWQMLVRGSGGETCQGAVGMWPGHLCPLRSAVASGQAG